MSKGNNGDSGMDALQYVATAFVLWPFEANSDMTPKQCCLPATSGSLNTSASCQKALSMTMAHVLVAVSEAIAVSFELW